VSSSHLKDKQKKLEDDPNLDEDGKPKRYQCTITLEKILDHWSIQTLLTLMTVYALIGDDIRVLSTSKPADAIFYGVTFGSLIIFTIEIIVQSICKEGYFLGFFFWLDLISTISLIMDIGWIWNPIMGIDESSTDLTATVAGAANTGQNA